MGGMATSATISGYVMKYEHDLEKHAESPITKKFAELREHNIDAGQGLFEIYFDMFIAPYDKDTSKGVLMADVTLLATKGKQQLDRYKSSAAAIATVLESAGIAMQPEDVGDICQRSDSSSNSKPTQTQTQNPPTQTQTQSPSVHPQPRPSSKENSKPSAMKADNAISIFGRFDKFSQREIRSAYERRCCPDGFFTLFIRRYIGG